MSVTVACSDSCIVVCIVGRIDGCHDGCVNGFPIGCAVLLPVLKAASVAMATTVSINLLFDVSLAALLAISKSMKMLHRRMSEWQYHWLLSQWL